MNVYSSGSRKTAVRPPQYWSFGSVTNLTPSLFQFSISLIDVIHLHEDIWHSLSVPYFLSSFASWFKGQLKSSGVKCYVVGPFCGLFETNNVLVESGSFLQIRDGESDVSYPFNQSFRLLSVLDFIFCPWSHVSIIGHSLHFGFCALHVYLANSQNNPPTLSPLSQGINFFSAS